MTSVKVRRVESRLVDVVCEITLQDPYERITSPDVIARVFSFLEDRPQEELWALYLNGSSNIIGARQVSVGTANSSLLHPREVFGPAVRFGAVSVVVVHNHPSGDGVIPSWEDLAATSRIFQSGELLGIPLIDHVVVGHRGFCSIRQQYPERFDQTR